MSGVYRPTFQDHETGRTKKCRFWYAAYRDHQGKRVRKPLKTTNRDEAELMLAKLLQEVADLRQGLTSPFDKHKSVPITQHLADFLRDMRARGLGEKHVDYAETRLRFIVTKADMKLVQDITPGALTAVLGSLKVHRRNKKGELKESTRPASVRTRNYYRSAFISFTKWLVAEQRLQHFPLGTVRAGNEDLDKRHSRRALLPAELDRLLLAARGGPPLEGIEGGDRAMLYLVAASTGFRASELASLVPESFNLAKCQVVVEATISKRRRKDTQPLHPSVVSSLSAWLAGKRAGSPLWPGAWPRQAARMMKFDLAVAGIAYETGEGFADFHALRHSYISHLVRSGVSPKLCQELARHSTIRLTMDRYCHTEGGEAARALGGVPPLV